MLLMIHVNVLYDETAMMRQKRKMTPPGTYLLGNITSSEAKFSNR